MKQKLAPIFRALAKGQLGVPLLLMTILAMVILPIPAIVLDMLFTFNIVLALLVMLISVYSRKPLDFSVFPSILLVATLLRLALNVASTRIVLLEGHLGGDAAGKVIQAFGDVVIGGNYVVGVVVFVILMIINFVVVTKGGERISEVSARFTLDAMPGKQMAIDADLNAGILDHQGAKLRREEVAKEADFYGSMDGASKFVRGDAIAGMLILFINLIGGVSIGVFQFGLTFGDAFQTYALLTIGDGLVAQIPSLLLATSAAIIVTRVADNNNLSDQITKQVLASPTALFVVSGIMLVLGLIPGMPHMAFLGFSAVVGFAGWRMREFQAAPEIDDADLQRAEEIVEQNTQPESKELVSSDIPHIHAMNLHVGYRLVSLIDRQQGAELLNRLLGIRKTLTEQRGFVIPHIHIRDDLALNANQYQITVRGAVAVSAEVEVDKLLAINPGQVYGNVDGILTKDPAYGMEAVWISTSDKDKAVNLGYTVVDHATIISTHVSKVINDHIEDILGPVEVNGILERLSTVNSKLADDLQNKLTHQQLLRVFRQLTIDGVPLSDMVTIANSLVESAELTKDPILLAADVRCVLRRVILASLIGARTDVPALTLSNELENILLGALSQAQAGGHVQLDGFTLEPSVIEKLQRSLPEALDNMRLNGHPPILLVMPQLRPLLARYARICSRGLQVLSFNEIPDNRSVSVVGHLG
ncbi:flagellar biosynthesis protein FlhA [Photobacterium aphoticum]|uniref:Flagellar biosynthesis protein FlhA n=1 Tax=Photobacterium aphoticum TaxID=754436 RepID=A0A0J1JFN4_9GAMM|nr:flagellar biosynthesis protein FlhA [Photobacterium aphoticum]KLV00642.1 flagellar biosynthesis protein FlhA [Photobacterium aphoticum]PSU50087.1 flagellar biosynthesis protein FlhA [Photobacterium aphoticum]GHA58820.1 flagellar biosynthesis protein [Photobacterium aphoticum]